MSADSPRASGAWRASLHSKIDGERPESFDSPFRKSYDIGTLTRELSNKDIVMQMLADENRTLKCYIELLQQSIQELGGEVRIST